MANQTQLGGLPPVPPKPSVNNKPLPTAPAPIFAPSAVEEVKNNNQGVVQRPKSEPAPKKQETVPIPDSGPKTVSEDQQTPSAKTTESGPAPTQPSGSGVSPGPAPSTDTGNGTGTGTGTGNGTGTGTGNVKVVNKIRPNLLSQLASYNYIIELQATDQAGLMKLQQTEEYHPADWVTIMSTSGGIGGVGVLRNSDGTDDQRWFTKEYYLDNFEIDCIVGINSNARATDDIQLTFNIIEPYGVNLIQELWEFNSLALYQENWIETCYLLKIMFKGYDDQGRLITLGDRGIVKYLPIHITEIDIKINSSGSVYTVTAVAFNGQGNDKRHGVLQKGVQCEGKTVQDVVLGPEGKTDLKFSKDTKSAEGEQKETSVTPLSIKEKPPNLKYALNAESNKEAQSNKASDTSKVYPIEYDFYFVGDLGAIIAKSLLSKPENIDPKDTSMNLPKNENEAQMLKNLKSYQLLGKRNSSDIQINVEKQKINFNGGKITEILSQIIINSTYITDQINEFRKNYRAAVTEKDPAARASKYELLKKPFNWFRITPKIYNTGNYDPGSNIDQKRIVYYIIGYQIDNAKGVGGHLVPSSKESVIELEAVKEYNYFFTGNNTEILDLDISLNTNYFTYRPRNPKQSIYATGIKPQKAEPNSSGVNLNSNEFKAVKTPLNAPLTSVPAPKNERPSVGMGTTTLDRNVAGQVTSALYSNVDQLSVTMNIMGDPDLIKQDGVFKTATEDSDEIPITFDNRERYVKVIFVNPRDIDDATGTLDKKGPVEQTVIFNGMYKIIEIKNFFKEGKFTQQLSLLRNVDDALDQPPDVKQIQDSVQQSGKVEQPIADNQYKEWETAGQII